MMQRLSWVSIAFFILPLTTHGQVAEKDTQKGQNLVYNPSFEEYYYCPPPMPKDSFPCKGWKPPYPCTPDYHHICSREPALKVPQTDAGYYLPKTGNAYMGFGLITIETTAMEHILGQLIEPLKRGKTYRVSFWVRLAHAYSDYAAYNIGAYFSTKPILSDKWKGDGYVERITSNLTAHVSNPKGNFITDTGWVEISGIYTAKGGEKYITIGMFWDDHPKVVKAWEKYQKYESWNAMKRLGKKIKKHLLKKILTWKNNIRTHLQREIITFLTIS